MRGLFRFDIANDPSRLACSRRRLGRLIEPKRIICLRPDCGHCRRAANSVNDLRRRERKRASEGEPCCFTVAGTGRVTVRACAARCRVVFPFQLPLGTGHRPDVGGSQRLFFLEAARKFAAHSRAWWSVVALLCAHAPDWLVSMGKPLKLNVGFPPRSSRAGSSGACPESRRAA